MFIHTPPTHTHAHSNCHNRRLAPQLFHNCLAPDTSGDGTGCDNMTAIIVTFDEHKQTQKRKLEADDEPVTKKVKDEKEGEKPQASASSS